MRNSLDKLLLDSKIFVDANIFLYAILGNPVLKPRCQKFLLLFAPAVALVLRLGGMRFGGVVPVNIGGGAGF